MHCLFEAKLNSLREDFMPSSQNSIEDATIVASTRVACDGGGGALGHPKTYLDMGQDTEVRCKYCGRVFKLDPKAVTGGH